FLVVALSSLGLPGLNGFVGEFLILVGAFQASRVTAVFATAGIVFAAVYMLWMYQRVVFGEVRHAEVRGLPDLNARELLTLVPIVILIVWIGVYPAPFTAVTEPSVAELLVVLKAKVGPTLGPWTLPSLR
ncbi:MAG: proton-conducting transporter membrane subunit, partial [Candidatus Rokuibacteriota bacterium]